MTFLLLLIFSYNVIFLFVGTASLGLFLSSTFPSMLAYTEDVLQYKGEWQRQHRSMLPPAAGQLLPAPRMLCILGLYFIFTSKIKTSPGMGGNRHVWSWVSCPWLFMRPVCVVLAGHREALWLPCLYPSPPHDGMVLFMDLQLT